MPRDSSIKSSSGKPHERIEPMDPVDLLPPNPNPAPVVAEVRPAEPRRETAPIVCGFCDCTLASRTGDVLKRGQKAGQYLDLDLQMKRQKDEVAVLEKQVTTLTNEVSRLKAEANDLRKRGTWAG